MKKVQIQWLEIWPRHKLSLLRDYSWGAELHDRLICCFLINVNIVGSHFRMGLRSRIFGCKSNRLKTSTI